jgi:hypothetical protein
LDTIDTMTSKVMTMKNSPTEVVEVPEVRAKRQLKKARRS